MSSSLKPMILRLLRFLPSAAFIRLVHLMYHHEWADFRAPNTFNQIIVAKKLYDHNPLYTATVDRVAVRDFVAERVGEQYLIPLLQEVRKPEDIDFDALGETGCVIKARHGYNMNIILPPGASIDRAEVLRQTAVWVKTNFYNTWREWAYRDCPTGLVIEQYIGDAAQPPIDYKFCVFHGEVGIIQVDTDRFIEHKSNVYDRYWNELNFNGAFPANEDPEPRPDNIDNMIELAERLASGMDFVRIDLYNVGGRLYFGEITHYPGAGIVAVRTPGLDLAIGELIKFGTPIPAQFFRKLAPSAVETDLHKTA